LLGGFQDNIGYDGFWRFAVVGGSPLWVRSRRSWHCDESNTACGAFRQLPLCGRVLFDAIDAFRIKRQMFADGGHGGIGSLVGPDSVDRDAITHAQVVVSGIALVRAMRRVRRALEGRHVGIRTWNILDHGQLRLRQRQGACRVGDDPAGEDDTNPIRVGDDRDGMLGAGNFHSDTPCSPIVAPVMARPSCLIPATLYPDPSGSRASTAWAGRL